jgi:hypothetical protein
LRSTSNRADHAAALGVERREVDVLARDALDLTRRAPRCGRRSGCALLRLRHHGDDAVLKRRIASASSSVMRGLLRWRVELVLLFA